MRTFDALSIALTGRHLIEASAGTGKTFSIASLYLRLLLSEPVDEVPLSVQNILVVTFTNDATEELRGRIRTRVKLAYLAFSEKDKSIIDNDAVIRSLYENCVDRKIACSILENALLNIDDAAIFTIHGFCQRVLSQQAFETGIGFQADFVLDESSLIKEVCQDYWREHIYPLGKNLTRYYLSFWKTPDALLKEVRQLLNRPDMLIKHDSDSLSLKEKIAAFETDFFTLQDLWLQYKEDLAEQFKVNKALNKQKLNSKFIAKYMAELHQFFTVETTFPTLALDTLDDKYKYLYRLSDLYLQSDVAYKDPAGIKISNVFTQALSDWLTALPALKNYVLPHFVDYTRSALTDLKRKKNIISSNDLLTQFSHALKKDVNRSLYHAVRHEFSVGIIDEFQDTDAFQYHIFDTLFPDATHDSLYLIGDPKQAIYQFRGGDIFTYLSAKQSTQIDHQHTLGVNYRSSEAMVTAVNTLFSQRVSPFIYDHAIPFEPVKAHHKKITYFTEAAMHFYWPDTIELELDKAERGKLNSAHLAKDTSSLCAQQIAQLLSTSTATIANERIQAGDIAILVRQHSEATAVQLALQTYGLSSVYISKNSVFETAEAQYLSLVFKALCFPEKTNILKAALCTPLFHLTFKQLNDIHTDQTQWDAVLDTFLNAALLAKKGEILSAFTAIFLQFNVFSRWFSTLTGDRTYTNVFQLIELLQKQWALSHDTLHLYHWLIESVIDVNPDIDEQQLRLESDSKLIKIVTIHKSKGLQYPIVFLPFLYNPFASNNQLKNRAKYHDKTQVGSPYVIDLDKTIKDSSDAMQEELAESIRLLYVAFTRAEHACYVGLHDHDNFSMSALAYLLQAEKEGDAVKAVIQKIQSLSEQLPYYAAASLSRVVPFQVKERSHADSAPVLDVKVFKGTIDHTWHMHSYSGIVHRYVMQESLPAGYETQQEHHIEGTRVEVEVAAPPILPKGAHTGNFLHDLLENSVFDDIESSLTDETIQAKLIAFQIIPSESSPELPHLIKATKALIDHTVNTHIHWHQWRFSLSQLSAKKCLPELEFFIPLSSFELSQFSLLLKKYPLFEGYESAHFEYKTLEGMLTGFIDLVFEYEGQYFILDYKSNYLGAHPTDYQADHMIPSMISHHYDIQLILYTLAVHKWLKWRIPDYDYDTHIGAGVYYFLRGLDKNSENTSQGIVCAKPDHALIEALDNMMSPQIDMDKKQESA